MSNKVLTVLTSLLVTFLSLYAIQWLSSSVSSVATSVSQLGSSAIFGDNPLHYHHHDVPAESLEKWRLAHLHQASLVLVVDLNGGGNFTSVQKAIEAVPNSSPSKTLILINAGVYREKVKVQSNKINVVLQGRGYKNTSIEWNDTSSSSGGTTESYSFIVYGINFVAHNISFKNTAPEPEPRAKDAQAIALRIDGDQAAFYGCGFYGAQDTLFDSSGKHFFKDCYIQGSVDFIFGNGRSLYQDCEIKSTAKESTSGISGFITAHARVSEDEKTGFSFVNCKIDGTGKILLGRAYRPYATVVFSNTFMSAIISPEGWSDFGNTTNDKTVTFGEYRCYGEGSNYKGRVSYGKQLTDSQAAMYTDISYIDGAKWLNQTIILSNLNLEEHKEGQDPISSF